MTTNEIAAFLAGRKHKTGNPVLHIRFKKRAAIEGIIVREKDFEDLKEKNFWRIVSLKDMPSWEDTHNIGLSRIFNGHDFRKLVYA